MARSAKYSEVLDVVTKPVLSMLGKQTISIFTAMRPKSKEVISVISAGRVLPDVVKNINAGTYIGSIEKSKNCDYQQRYYDQREYFMSFQA